MSINDRSEERHLLLGSTNSQQPLTNYNYPSPLGVINSTHSLTESTGNGWSSSLSSSLKPAAANNGLLDSQSGLSTTEPNQITNKSANNMFESSLTALSSLNALGASGKFSGRRQSRPGDSDLLEQPEEVGRPPSLLNYSRKQLLTLAAVAYGNFWVAACVSLQAPFFPAEAERKGASATVYGLIFGIYELVICVTAPIFGRLVSRVAPNFLVESGLFVAGVSTVLFGTLSHVPAGATFITLAFLVRIFEGVGAAAFMTASYSIMASEFPDRVATTFALLETCFGLGLILGPTVGGAIFQLGGYPLPFLILGTFLLLGSFVTFLCLPVSGETIQGKPGNMVAFMSDFGIIIDALAIATALNFIGFNAATLEPHLRQFNLSPVTIGSVFILTGAVYALTSPIMGKLCDMGFNEMSLCLAGCVLVLVGSALMGPLPFFDLEPQLWMIIVALLVIGLGISAKLVTGFVDAISQSIKRRGLPDDMTTYGMVSAMFFSSCSVGAFIGPSAGGYLLEHYGYRRATIYLVVVDFCMIGLLIAYKAKGHWDNKRNSQRGQAMDAEKASLKHKRISFSHPSPL